MTKLKAFEMEITSPESSAILIIPSQSAISPIRPKEIVTANSALLIAASVTASIFPFIAPTIIPLASRTNQIILIIIFPPPYMIF